MRERNTLKFGIGVALAALVGFGPMPAARADNIADEPVAYTDPAIALVMPFDVRQDHASFELVNRLGGDDTATIATHWSFWSDSCKHLADVFICLTNNDTVVVDPTALQGQIQIGQTNTNTGAPIDLSGERGFVTVTAFFSDTTASTCEVPLPVEDNIATIPSLVGSWVVANTKTNAAFGNDAIGIVNPGDTGLPDAASIFPDTNTSGIQIPFYAPDSLTDSEVYVIGIAFPGGNGEFAGVEIGPIPSLRPDGNAMCCNAAYFDNLENRISVDDLCFKCASMSSLTEALATKSGNDSFLIKDSKKPVSSGFLRLYHCVVGQDSDPALVDLSEGSIVSDIPNIGDESTIFPFAIHGMAVGPFGTAVHGKYTTPQ